MKNFQRMYTQKQCAEKPNATAFHKNKLDKDGSYGWFALRKTEWGQRKERSSNQRKSHENPLNESERARMLS